MDNIEGDEFLLLNVVPTLSELEQALLWRSFGTARKIGLAQYTLDNVPPDTKTCSEAVMAKYIMTPAFQSYGSERVKRRFSPTGEASDKLEAILQALMDRHEATLDHVGRDGFAPVDITKLLDALFRKTEGDEQHLANIVFRMFELLPNNENLMFLLRQYSRTARMVEVNSQLSRWGDQLTSPTDPFAAVRDPEGEEEY